MHTRVFQHRKTPRLVRLRVGTRGTSGFAYRRGMHHDAQCQLIFDSTGSGSRASMGKFKGNSRVRIHLHTF